MSQNCDNNCAGCPQDCSDRTSEQIDFTAHLHPQSSVKGHAVKSGKAASANPRHILLAVGLMKRPPRRNPRRRRYRPLHPQSFGLTRKASGAEPASTPSQAKAASTSCPQPLPKTTPIPSFAPIIGGTVKQFWTDVIWENVDYMLVDMPPAPATPLTVFQSSSSQAPSSSPAPRTCLHGRRQISQMAK